ncbi:unnamed protein product [Musa acuminata subsp. malaccensis]|nr:unnamed protein product [Musa acuminata subsp. malaccensis]
MISEAFASSDTNNFGHLSTRVISRKHNWYKSRSALAALL